MGLDALQIEVLPDGTVKVTSDEVSGPNHMAAEQFLRYLASLMGGPVTTVKRRDAHAHSHVHARGHAHQH